MPLEDFFIAYGKQDRAPGEFVSAVTVPRLEAGAAFPRYKISKRFDQDISALLGAFRFAMTDGALARHASRSAAWPATPKRAAGAEAALTGFSPGDTQAVARAAQALAQDYKPIDRHAGKRGLPHAGRAEPARQGSGGDRR